MLDAKTNGLNDGNHIVGHIHADKHARNKYKCCAHRTRPPKSFPHLLLLEITRFLTLEFLSAIVIFHASIERKWAFTSAEKFTKKCLPEMQSMPQLVSGLRRSGVLAAL